MRTITPEELKETLRLHKLWLDEKDGGVKADLRCADLRCADLRCADLRCADLHGIDLRWAYLRLANLSNADLRWANLSGADIDYASLSFSCKTLNMITDDRIKVQYLYHVARQKGDISDPDLNELISSDLFKKVCNKFHRVNECGKIE